MSNAPAPTAAEQAVIDRFDAAPVPPEVVAAAEAVETVARAIWESHPGAVPWDELSPRTPTRTEYRRLAAAAIAALPPSPAEGAVRDVLRVHHPIMRSETGPFSGCRCGQVKLGEDVIAHVIGHLLAALASPAPAPQGEEEQR